ncbi:hypothetical protein ACFWHQ_10945 [Streptomyces sp. NPDC060334]|uniref:hypothetical protein n=1 Tax=unclassified Streptomyces TaxID=2593676 RepID=UPI00333243EA
MYDSAFTGSTFLVDSAATPSALDLVIENLDQPGDQGVALFTICLVAVPATGRLSR